MELGVRLLTLVAAAVIIRLVIKNARIPATFTLARSQSAIR